MEEQGTYSVAVIDFGTEKIKGAVADKKADGSFKIVAREEVKSGGCIVRGVVYNLEETAKKLNQLLDLLEKQLGRAIVKVYTNIGGQSLHSREHELEETFAEEHELTHEDIDNLVARLNTSTTDDKYVSLGEIDQVYYANNAFTENPVGVKARTLRVKSQMILARKSLREGIYTVLEDKLHTEVASTLPSPIILGDRFLTKEQKRIGCAIIDFGSGCTSVAVYDRGVLIGLFTLPLGSRNITYDLTALHISSSEAERIKKDKGSANASKSQSDTVEVQTADERSSKELPLFEVNQYVEARAQEIVDNILNYVNSSLGHTNLPGGIVLTGGGSKLKELPHMVANSLHSKVEMAASQKDPDNGYYVSNPEWNVVYGMCTVASQECTAVFEEPEEPETHEPIQPKAQNIETSHTISGSGSNEEEDYAVVRPSLLSDEDWDELTSNTEVEPEETDEEARSEASRAVRAEKDKRARKAAEKDSRLSLFNKMTSFFEKMLPSEVDEAE